MLAGRTLPAWGFSSAGGPGVPLATLEPRGATPASSSRQGVWQQQHAQQRAGTEDTRWAVEQRFRYDTDPTFRVWADRQAKQAQINAAPLYGYRWAAPPNWPQPPAGWLPNIDWRPDPAWGPAPDGWEFWQKYPSPWETLRHVARRITRKPDVAALPEGTSKGG